MSEEKLMRALYEQHADVLLRFVLRFTPDRSSAEDVVQETMLRAWRHLDRIDPTRGNPRSYLLTVARNVLTDRWRASERRPRLVTDDQALRDAPGDEDVDRALDGWLISEALSRLSAEHAAVVQALFYEDQSVADAAIALGVPQGTVRSRSYYAVRALRAAFDEMGVTR